MKKPAGLMTRVGVKIFVLYAEKMGAELGARACTALRASLGETFHLTQSVWNAELLKSAKLRELAAREAAESDVVLVAAWEGNPPAEEVLLWLDRWQKRSRSSPAALVALLKRKTIYSPHSIRDTLHQFASAAGLDFFCHSEVRKPAPRPDYSVVGTV